MQLTPPICRHANGSSYRLLVASLFIVLTMTSLRWKTPEPTWTAAVVPPLLSFDGQVRECITGAVIGRVPHDLPPTEPFDAAKLDVEVEDAEHRRQTFQTVFDRRIWGGGVDPVHKGPLASGNIIFMRILFYRPIGLHNNNNY